MPTIMTSLTRPEAHTKKQRSMTLQQSWGAGGGTKKLYVKMQWLWPNKKGAQKSVTLNVKSGCIVEAKKTAPPPPKKNPSSHHSFFRPWQCMKAGSCRDECCTGKAAAVLDKGIF